MKTILAFFTFILVSFTMNAQDLIVDVWPNGAPDDNGLTGPEVDLGNNRINNISVAKMYVYLPEKKINTGVTVILCPGGGYFREAMSHEGYEVAEWLKSKGITGIVLKYRLPNGHPQIPSQDAGRALRIVRQHAEEWGINPNKVGIGGSSAGGHLASTVGTKFDSGDKNANDPVETFSSRPDFMLLLYPFIYFNQEEVQNGKKNLFLGENNNWETAKQYSAQLHVTEQTPPAFFVLADNDKSVNPKNSIEFYLALKNFNVPSEMHIFQEGGHGFGITKQNLPVDEWPELFYNWLKAIKMID